MLLSNTSTHVENKNYINIPDDLSQDQLTYLTPVLSTTLYYLYASLWNCQTNMIITERTEKAVCVRQKQKYWHFKKFFILNKNAL